MSERAPAARVRVLGPGDEPALARFLAAHSDTTLFLQSNLRAGGIVDRGAPQQGTFAAAWDGAGAVAAVAWHGWNGIVLVEAPVALDAVARAAVAATGRRVAGILGPHAQVVAARRALGLAEAPAAVDSREDLLALPLAALRVPEALARGALRVRAPRADELGLVTEWRLAYSAETLGQAPAAGARAEAQRAAARREMELYQELGRHFVLEAEGRAVAYAAYNAETPACVQIGGVWTPPPLRGRGYAKAVVAGALCAARARGVARSVLFTDVANHPAQAAYRALGYERVGDYGMVLFA